jgi:hypothetical protein
LINSHSVQHFDAQSQVDGAKIWAPIFSVGADLDIAFLLDIQVRN